MNASPGTSATIVRFVGVATAIALAIGDRSSRSHLSAQNADEIGPAALAQITALLNEKASRSRSEQKLDSQLLYGLKMARGQAIASGVSTIETNLRYEPDNQLVLDVSGDRGDQLAAQLLTLGVQIIHADPRDGAVRVRARLDQVDAMAALPAVTFVQPKQEAVTLGRAGSSDRGPLLSDDRGLSSRPRTRDRAPLLTSLRRALRLTDAVTSVGSKNSEGDVTHRASTVRTAFRVDGTGVKIGVISDGVNHLAPSQASGDLGAVTVLPGQGGTGDEGTAMLEIIHDLAPGAQLYFATALTSITSFAQNIRDLRAAGCDIIVDDVGYFVETPFQDGQTSSVISTRNGGVVIQAVKDVTASGALYFSSAGNSGNKNDNTSGTWEGDFVDGGPASTPLPVGSIHSFGAQTHNSLTATNAAPTNLHWSDPLGGSANDYDLFRLNSTGTTVLASSTNIQTGTQDPYEQISGGSSGDRIVIVKKTGAAGRFLHLDTNRGRLSISTAGEIHGHAATSAAGSFGVAATPAIGPYPSPFNSSNVVETFSSDGPRRIFFNGDGTRITPNDVSATGGQVLSKPDLTAADGVSVTGLGGFPSPFFGTSASAPHVAAIAALVKSANPSLTAAQIRSALVSTAIDIETAGLDRDSGAGIVNAFAAVQSIALANTPPTLSAIPAQMAFENVATTPIAFTVGDAETAAASLSVSVRSSDLALVPNANLVLGGSGANRTLTITPAATNQPFGTAIITVTVSDGVLASSGSFTLGLLQAAVYDATLQAPKCAVVGNACQSGTLLVGRGTMPTGLELHQPNTIMSSCADGTSGAFHVDESIDFIKVSTVDGGPFAPGKTVRIAATVWVFNDTPISDRLDLYFASDASNPSWTFAGTQIPSQAGLQTLSATYVLPAGSMQAVRANHRFGGSASVCTAGSFNDHDDLIFSVGPVVPPVAVPNVVGQTQGAATTAITGAGLVVGTMTTASSATVPAGSVISQNPVGGTQVATGSAVNLVVSTGPSLVPVPNVIGLTQATATTSITGAGLVLGTVTTASSTTVPAGSVISQTPVGGTQVVTSSAVNFVVSTGPPLVAAPNVVGLAQVAATTAITGAGLVVGLVTNASSSTVPAGSVISQTPVGGTQVAPGSAVNLTVSSGPPVDLSISETHTGRFTQGQTGATYTITVTNLVGSGPANGTVMVTETVPAGLTATAVGGTGWTCAQPAGPCTRGDALTAGASYPALTLTVNVASNAPAIVTNVATVSGGGDVTPANNTASDPTQIVRNSQRGPDVDGDGRSDLVVFRPSIGGWFIRSSSQGFATTAQFFQWGLPGDLPIAGDFDGDGKSELTVFRPPTGQWFIRYSSQNYDASTAGVYQWGLSGDVPIAGDFDGDGKSDLAVYRPSIGGWFIRYSSQGYSIATASFFQWGLPGDMPIAADFDGDGKTELTVFRPPTGEWFIRYSAQSYAASTVGVYQWGLPGDVPLSSDFDGDGKTELAVFRPSIGGWFIRYSSQGYSTATASFYQWGLAGDVPIAADFDADGKPELTVFRPATGEWFIRYSAQSYDASAAGVYQWGLAGDVPVKP